MFTIRTSQDMLDGFTNTRGGPIGDGAAAVVSFATSDGACESGDCRFITYEKMLNGDRLFSSSGHRASAVARRDSIAPPARVPALAAGGIAVSISVEAVDRYLADCLEERSEPVQCRGVGAGRGSDGALFGLAVHALDNFDRYDYAAASRAGQHVETLITVAFIQVLRDTGSLALRDASADRRAMILKRARDFIGARYAEPLTIPDIASAVGTNLRSLQMAFQDRLNMTPHRYLTSVRLERAREMLTTPGARVTTVVYDCGFTHIGRFGQIYRDRFGELPSQTLNRTRQGLSGANGAVDGTGGYRFTDEAVGAENA